MRIIKEPTLRGYWRDYPDAQPALEHWLLIARHARWQNIQDTRRDFPHADAVVVASGNSVTVFNVAGNKYRLIVSIKYGFGVVYIRDFLTHAEYSDGSWKGRH